MTNWMKTFPKCGTKNPREAGFDSTTPYLCAVVDDRFEKNVRFMVLFPYHETAEGGEEDYFSWWNENNVYAHVENSFNDHSKVVKWCKYADAPEFILELMEGVK